MTWQEGGENWLNEGGGEGKPLDPKFARQLGATLERQKAVEELEKMLPNIFVSADVKQAVTESFPRLKKPYSFLLEQLQKDFYNLSLLLESIVSIESLQLFSPYKTDEETKKLKNLKSLIDQVSKGAKNISQFRKGEKLEITAIENTLGHLSHSFQVPDIVRKISTVMTITLIDMDKKAQFANTALQVSVVLDDLADGK